MTTNEQIVLDTIAKRLAARIHGRRMALAHAPAEFRPIEILRLAMAEEYGPDGYVAYELPNQIHEAMRALPQGRAVLAIVNPTSLAEREALRDSLPMDQVQHSPVPIVVAAEGDDLRWIESVYYDQALNHEDFSISLPEFRTILGADATPDRVARLAFTGGVPSLVIADLDDEAEQLLEICNQWASRCAEAIAADPLLLVAMMSGSAISPSIAKVASKVLNRPITASAVDEVRHSSLLTRSPGPQQSLPILLEAAFGRWFRSNQPERFERAQAVLREAVRTDDTIDFLDRLRMLTTLREWDALDEVLNQREHLLIHLGVVEKKVLVQRWPSRPPHWLPRLVKARTYLEGIKPTDAMPPGTAESWVDLGFLFAAEGHPDPGTVVGRGRAWFDQLTSRGRPLSLAAARSALQTATDWMLTESESLEASPDADPDAAPFLIGMLTGVVDAALMLGHIRLARQCLDAAMTLSFTMGNRIQAWSSMWPAMVARSAVVAAKSGLPQLAERWIVEYRRVSTAEFVHDDLIDLAERYVIASADELLLNPEIRNIDPEVILAPQKVEAEALRLALLQGQEVAREWARNMAGRAVWSRRPDWEWWPLQATLAMLEAQGGRAGQAQAALDRNPLPPALDVTVRAAIEFSFGRIESARQLAEQVLSIPELSNRWRVLAAGVKLACLASDGGNPTDEQALLATVDWSEALSSIVLFPDTARALVVAQLDPRVTQLPGLQVTSRTPGPAQAEVSLTPRQIEVLKLLAEGGTMAEVAKELYLSKETIRSTAKEAYRRLGVHNKEAAIRWAEALGLL